MRLNELFVSHKQVDPVKVEHVRMPEPNPIYANLERAQQAASTTSEEEPAPAAADMSEWKVGGSGGNWVVDTMTSGTSNEQSSQPASSAPAAPSSSSAPRQGSVSGHSGYLSRNNMADRAKYWMGLYANLGLSKPQQVALVAAMIGECALNPRGAVERKELAGGGNTKAGWAHAGEGAIGFTHWDTKKKYIEMYNADPKRKGPKLSTNEAEYAKASSRHIADLDDEDQALITYHFYKDVLGRSGQLSFQDLIADFYLQKAGRGFGKGAGKGASLYDQAMHTGRVYQKSHAKLGYHKAAQTNTFERTMQWANELADLVGYKYA